MTDRLGITVPVISAPMAGVADARLAVAVTRAGAFGTIGIGSAATPEWTREQVGAAVAAGVPFGVGFMGWALDRDITSYEIALAAQPALVSLAFVDPVGGLAPHVDRARQAGSLVAIQVGTVAEALVAAELGADFVVVRGGEAGGHGRDAVSTLVLLQQVLDAVQVPVVAAGGITGARGLAAVLAAGAVGAWVGTAFAGCVEATSSPAARDAMAGAEATDTVYTRVFDIAQRIPWPERFGGRALANEFTETWAGRAGVLQTVVDAQDGDPNLTITADMRRARAEADIAMAPVYCGQGVAQIRVDVPAADVVAEFARAGELLRAAAG